jgi:hypothetical protein
MSLRYKVEDPARDLPALFLLEKVARARDLNEAPCSSRIGSLAPASR